MRVIVIELQSFRRRRLRPSYVCTRLLAASARGSETATRCRPTLWRFSGRVAFTKTPGIVWRRRRRRSAMGGDSRI